MELLERYIEAVRKRLPWDRQDDIAAELRTNLQAQLEDRENGLGRPLTAEESDAWIRQLGSPRRMADQYRPARSLIGPEQYYNYLFVLRIVLGWTVALTLFFGAFSVSQAYPHVGPTLLNVMRQLWGNLLNNTVVVTLIFAALDFVRTRSGAKLLESDWSPRDLPPLEHPTSGHMAPRKRSHVIASFIFGCLGLVWLLLLPSYPFMIIGPGAFYLSSFPFLPTPALQLIYWLIVGQLALSLVWRAFTIVSGGWRWRSPVELMVFRLIGIAPIVVALTAPDHQFVRLANPGAAPANLVSALPVINQAFLKLAILIFIIGLLQLGWQIVRLTLARFRQRASHAALHSTPTGF